MLVSTIASSFAGCLETYEDLISYLAAPGCLYQEQISQNTLQDELGRFKVWAGNIAAHKTGRSSLDFRLRDASSLRERIVGLLKDMDDLLREACEIAAGERPPRDEVFSDPDSSDDELELEDAAPNEPAEPLTTELQQIFEDVVVCIDCLYKLSMTIRNAAPHDRLVKAASIDTTYYEIWDIQHVKTKYPAAKEFLAARLGKSISRRRQYFKYCEKHHRKLAQDMVIPQKSASLPKPLPVEATPDTDLIPKQDSQNGHAEVSGFLTVDAAESAVATTVLTQTTASEFVAANADFEVESDSGQTSTSYATTLSGGGKLSIPPMPKKVVDGRAFECPYCFTIVSIKNAHAWKKHIFRDLQPYVCTFEGCPKSSKLFDSRRDWFDHESQVHRNEWLCSADCEESFSSRFNFERHMRNAHSISSPNQLTALAEMCQRPVDEDAEAQCSLCPETLGSMKQLCRHLARHLEELALFALPHRRDSERDEEFGSDRVQASELSRGLSEASSLTFDSNPETEGSSSEPDFDQLEPVKTAEAIDRAFVQALEIVKRVPKTGAARPSRPDRLRLYGIYRQAMEGDVDDAVSGLLSGQTGEELNREKEKYEAWAGQKGIGQTEAKRRYIEALMEVLHLYGTTNDAWELAAELESIWDQTNHNQNNENVTSSGVSELLRAFGTESHQLPVSIMKVFDTRLKNILDGTDTYLVSQDPSVADLFRDVSIVLSGKEFPSLLNRETQLADLVLMIYLRVNKCYQKRSGSDQEAIWIRLVDDVRALFVRLIVDILERSNGRGSDLSEMIGLLKRLDIELSTRSQTAEPKSEEDEHRRLITVEINQDWAKYWDVKGNIDGHPQEEVDVQNYIHQFWISEMAYVKGLMVTATLYHDDLIDDPGIKLDGQRFEFVEDAFSHIETLKHVHQMFLSRLENRIRSQGPWVVRLSDVFQYWISLAKDCYSGYAEHYPINDFLIRRESSMNPPFKQSFDSDTARMNWLKYLTSPSTRIREYVPLLESILEKMSGDAEDKGNLQSTLEDLKSLVKQFDKSEARGYEKCRLREVQDGLVLSAGLPQIDLHLDDEHRRIIHEGDLSELKTADDIRPVMHAILLDNYLVLGIKTSSDKRTGTEKYNVMSSPIPMALLMLDGGHDFALSRRSLDHLSHTENAEDTGEHSYPFRIRHLGKPEVHVLFAKTENERKEWRANIIWAKASYATFLQSQNAEVFSVSLVCHGAVQSRDNVPPNNYFKIQGTSLAREAGDSGSNLSFLGTAACATSLELYDTRWTIVGTSQGFHVFTAELPPRILFATPLPNVKQIRAIPEFNMLVILASTTLYIYKLDGICDSRRGAEDGAVSRMEHVKREEIQAFVAGNVLGRIMIFCTKAEKSRTLVKILEPYTVPRKETKPGASFSYALFGIEPASPPQPPSHNIKTWDEFYLPYEASDIKLTLLKSKVAIRTKSGFEIMALETKETQPLSLSDPRKHSDIFGRIRDETRPLAIFRFEGNFLIVYEDCALWIDRNGELSSIDIIHYAGRAESAAFDGSYLILFHSDFVEIRDVRNGELRQVIAGQNIRCLDDAQGMAPRNVLMAMAHPELEGRELVLELALEQAIVTEESSRIELPARVTQLREEEGRDKSSRVLPGGLQRRNAQRS